MNEYDFRNLTTANLELAAEEYHERGFILLNGIEEITSLFPEAIAGATGLQTDELERLMDPQSSGTFEPSLRQSLSKVRTTTEMAERILSLLKPLLLRFLGPIVHVSSDFHAQFKGGDVEGIGYPGFHARTDYIEIHGPHLLHQDFAGASFPISPSMVTLWVALNTTASWKLRLYPKSHWQGLLCNTFLDLANERLKTLGEPVDIPACKGKAVLFNGLVLHGTGVRGPERRASCDIRFFPLCGFLPSTAHVLHESPSAFLHNRLDIESNATLQSPLYESLVFLGESSYVREKLPQSGETVPHSPLNWVGYLIHLLHGKPEQGLADLRRLVNAEFGADGPEVFVKKFTGHPVHPGTIRIVRENISRLNPEAPELRQLDSLINSLS